MATMKTIKAAVDAWDHRDDEFGVDIYEGHSLISGKALNRMDKEYSGEDRTTYNPVRWYIVGDAETYEVADYSDLVAFLGAEDKSKWFYSL